jgi:transcriptional regulator with XRE-family HTH domain
MTSDEFLMIRRTLRLTQHALAEKLGVDSNTVARWERGERPILPITELAMGYLVERPMTIGSGYKATVDGLTLFIEMKPDGKEVAIFRGKRKVKVPHRPTFSFENGLEPNVGTFQGFAIEQAYAALGRDKRPSAEDVLSVEWERY